MEMFQIVQQFVQQKKMDTEPKSLFTKAKSSSLGKNIGKWKVKKMGASLTVELYQKGLLEIDEAKNIEFDFDLKFSFSKENCEVKFERGKDTCIYILASVKDLESWRDILKYKINQRGFHEQFKPLKKIGKGNFASVYLAQKLESGVHYAVKAFSKEAAYSEENGKQCLIKQIDIARSLDHRNTMKLYEVFESQNSLYIIFQLLSGGQLYDKVKSKYKFKPHQIKVIVQSILKGLREMHSKGIMHRDLKPENILFKTENEWECVIADYGLAEFSDIESYLFVRCGTPGYVAPEVINIKVMTTKYKPICDVYSMGLIFHLLLYGKSAFPGTTYNEVLAQNRAANIDLSSEEHKKAGSQVLDLLTQMLAKNPNQRISAQKALQHSYFKDMEDKYESQASECQKIDTSSTSTTDYPNCDSPLLTTANTKRKENKLVKKDSCVDFHMGKQNVFTGKTDQVQSMKSNKVSIVNTATPLKKPKMSQFCNQNK